VGREVEVAGKGWDGRGRKGQKPGKGNWAARRRLLGGGLMGSGWRWEDGDNQGGQVNQLEWPAVNNRLARVGQAGQRCSGVQWCCQASWQQAGLVGNCRGRLAGAR